MDSTYRTELRTLNDTNFARFEALLDARFARAELHLAQELSARFRAQDQSISAMRSQLERTLTEHLKWMVGLSIANAIALIGVVVAVLALR